MVPRIPFVVIGGFLGAGKTTLLNRWLREAEGQRLAVLVNDFGAIDVDGTLLDNTAGHRTLALANGCVCCAVGDDLGGALTQVLAMTPAVDAIVVETSGVADPWRVAQYALADPALVLEAVVVLVDTAAIVAMDADRRLADSVRRPLAHADLVLLNHADRCDAITLSAAEAWAAAHAPTAPRLTTSHADLPWPAVCGAGLHVARGGWPAGPDPRHGQRFAQWATRGAGPYDPALLRQWLRQLPAGVLRLKGLLPLADGRWAELQYAGRHGSLRLRDARKDLAPALVAIGLAGELPERALEAGLAATRG
ncbi:GTP-binding protein [Rubrivivax albus]|uniref:GTP-binding protein n=1 Tax=Rubrivivax albus TaxID=2499835 RepID=A0A437K1N3_9BURK|nr:GTP-binding protein [Rubrivivax albus]